MVNRGRGAALVLLSAFACSGEVLYTADASLPDAGTPSVILPRTSIGPDELAVIVNDDDADSLAIGAYYAQQRGIPPENVVHVTMSIASDILPATDFAPILATVEAAVPAGVQAYALTWIKPYRVGCMSITSAFALGGYDDQYCNTSTNACSPTSATTCYNSDSTRPFDDHGIRPAMILAGATSADAMAVIDRGVAADATFPPGTGHFVRTTDSARSNPRYSDFMATVAQWDRDRGIASFYTDNSLGSGSNVISGEVDVLFYLTGLTQVAELATNTYRPGAIADHVTSFGGRLTATSGQMSILRWLEGGATASYGTVVEPCAYPQKFSRASVLLEQYFRGGTLIEAYWKSVSWPGEGVFVGDPLAKPWGSEVAYAGGTLTLRTTTLWPDKVYSLMGADSVSGPYDVVRSPITVDQYELVEIVVPDADLAVYELVEAL